MIEVMRLELKKMAWKKYLLATIILVGVILFFLLSPLYLMKGEEIIYQTPLDLLNAGGVLLRVTFTILFGVMIASSVIKEYETGTILNLFLYPIAKKKILLGKLILIVGFGCFMMLFAQLIVSSISSWLNNSFQLVPGQITFDDFKLFLLSSLVLILGTSATSMLALLVGLKTKSSVATIVSSIVVALLINGNLGTASRFSANLIGMLVLSFIGVLIVFFAVRNVEYENL